MKKFAFLTVAASLALVSAVFATGSTQAVSTAHAENAKTFKFVERLGSATVFTPDEENQSVSFKGGWDGHFLVAQGVDLTDDKTTFSVHVKGTNGDGADLQNGFGIYHDDQNYMKAYFKWNNKGTIEELCFHGQVGGVYQSSWAVAKDQANADWSTVGEFYDVWSDGNDWTVGTDVSSATSSNFRSETAITLASGFDMGISIEKVTYKERVADRIQLSITAVGTDNETHTWYTPSVVMDAFTNPNGGADSSVKNSRPLLGLYNNGVDAVTYSDFKQNGSSIKFRTASDSTGTVTMRSICGTPSVREVNAETQEVNYQGAWDSAFLLADGLDTSEGDFKFSTHVSGTSHDGGDMGIGYTLYYDANNYIKFYYKWNNCGTIGDLVVHGKVGGNSSDSWSYARDPWDSWTTPQGEYYDAWSDNFGWITDSTVPDTSTVNFNKFRSESEIFLDTGFDMGISVKRTTYKNRACDAVQLSVTANGKDGTEHTWYTPTVCIDAFTCPKGGDASSFANEAPKLALNNYNVGTIKYSNFKFNNHSIDLAAPNYYTVSFDYGDIPTQTIEDGLKATKPEDPVQEGYVFDKWMNGEEEYDFNAPVTSNIELTATWLNNTAVVTFDSNGGSSVDAVKVIKGEKTAKPADPSKQWNTFEGWYAQDAEEPFDFENTPITENITLVAHWTENEIKTERGVYLNKFVAANGTPAVLNASEDGESLNYQGGWDGQFIVTDQFDTSKTNWEFGAHLSGNVGDGTDTMAGFVVYYNSDNYILIYARWSNAGTIDGVHMMVRSNGATNEVYQGCRDFWGESLETQSTFYDKWSHDGGWTTGQRTPYGTESEGNWNTMRSTSQLLLNTGFDMKLYVENTTYQGRDVQKLQLGFTDLDKNSVKTSWYTPMIVCDAFTNPFGGEASSFKGVAPKVGFANNKVGTVNISDISFKETATRTVTFDVDGETTTSNVINGYRVDKPQDPVKEGYTFKYWALDGEEYDFNNAVNGNITLVAVFEENEKPDVPDGGDSSSSEAPDSSSEAPDSSSDAPVSSSEEPVSSSEQPVTSSEQPATSSSGATDNPTTHGCGGGCGGSILGVSALLSVFAGVGLIIAKSKKED